MSHFTDDQLLGFASRLSDFLTLHLKALKDLDSWIYFYTEKLQIKPPTFTFLESKEQFRAKLACSLDLVEFAHLFCKLARPTEYVKKDHAIHRKTSNYLQASYELLSYDEFIEIRNRLKDTALFGAN